MRSIAGGIGFSGVLLLASCGDLGPFAQVQKDFHYSHEMKPGSQLEIQNRDGAVQVIGWDRNALEVAATKYGSSEEQVELLKIMVTAESDGARIKTEAPEMGWHGNYGVRYTIHVPHQTKLTHVVTTNGSIAIEDLIGVGSLRSTNGRVSLARDSGEYYVETSNGSIEWDECSGLQRAHTRNGSVRGRLKAGAIDAETTNGSVDVTLDQPLDGKPVRLSTTNGSINLTMVEFNDNPVTARSTHGTVVLRLPNSTNALVDADTRLASISNNLPLSTTEELSKHHLKAQVGSGGPTILAQTTMGAIRIERY